MQPNPFMDASKFLARLATIYLVQNNAFIVPMEDSAGRLIGYYPVLPQQSSVREYGGEPYLQYSFWGGQKAAIELNRAGILTQHQYEDDFFARTTGRSCRPCRWRRRRPRASSMA